MESKLCFKVDTLKQEASTAPSVTRAMPKTTPIVDFKSEPIHFMAYREPCLQKGPCLQKKICTLCSVELVETQGQLEDLFISISENQNLDSLDV